MSLLIVVNGLKAGDKDRFIFAKSPVRFGRNELNEFCLDFHAVSRWHAIIHFDDRSIQYKDLGSTNGTKLNGEVLPPRQPVTLTVRDKLTVGPLTLTFEQTDEVVQSKAQARQTGQGTMVDADALDNLRIARAAMESIQPFYESFQKEWKKLERTLRSVVEGRAPQLQSMLLAAAEDRFPGLKAEADYRAFKSSLKLPDLDDAPAQIAHADELVHALGLPLGVDEGTLLKALLEILPAFCASFVELRRGFEQFSDELAVNMFEESTPLTTAESAQAVLEYLITAEPGENSRVRELNGSFADMMIHQVALISGVMEGVRGLLAKFSPASIAQSLKKTPEAIGPFKVRGSFWPLSTTALWRRFAAQHKTLLEDEQSLNQVLFGRDFARSYDAARSRKDVEMTTPIRDSDTKDLRKTRTLEKKTVKTKGVERK